MKFFISVSTLILILIIFVGGGIWLGSILLNKWMTPKRWVTFLKIFLILAIIAIQIDWFLKLQDAIRSSPDAVEWYFTGTGTTAIALAPGLYPVYKKIREFFKK